MLRPTTIVLLTLAAVAYLLRAPVMVPIFLALAAVALAVRAILRGPEPRDIPDFADDAPDQPAEPPGPRLEAALNQARRELGQPESSGTEDIEFASSLGRGRLRVGYYSEVPFVAIRIVIGDETEMAFVVRRRRSNLGLPRVVENTPVDTASFEYRLRPMELHGALSGHFEAATNRPRLFTELLDVGLADDLEHAMFDPRYRVEDITFGGESLTMVIQPAADPASQPFAHDCLSYARPFVFGVQQFIRNAVIPSAQGSS